jgi:hypothetical protein
MKNKKALLTREDLSNVTAGAEAEELIPAPPPGYRYCKYYRTCPSFDWRVCIFPINDIGPAEEASRCAS